MIFSKLHKDDESTSKRPKRAPVKRTTIVQNQRPSNFQLPKVVEKRNAPKQPIGELIQRLENNPIKLDFYCKLILLLKMIFRF